MTADLGIAAEAKGRETLFRRLEARNRFIGRLRWVVPTSGGIVLVALVLQLLLESLSNQFGVSNLRIDRNNLVVDSPRLTATGAEGAVYDLEAREARAPIGDTDKVLLTDAVFTLRQMDGDRYVARAAEGRLSVSAQQLNVDETVTVTGSDGLKAFLDGVFIDYAKTHLTASEHVEITLPDGSVVVAETLDYDGQRGVWQFGKARVTLPMTPGEDRQ